MASYFTRNALREILGEVDPKVLDSIYSLYQSSIDGVYISKLDSQRAVDEALIKYKSENPQKKFDDFDEYKNLKKEYNSLLLNNTIKEAKVKNRYIDIVKGKIDSTDVNGSLAKIREEYPEFFEGDVSNNSNTGENTASTPKPAISANVQSSETPDASKQLMEQFLKGLNS